MLSWKLECDKSVERNTASDKSECQHPFIGCVDAAKEKGVVFWVDVELGDALVAGCDHDERRFC